MLDLLLESSSDDICYRRSDSLENDYREVRESVGHTSRRDHKLIQRPDEMHSLYTWRVMRDSKEGDPAINASNATASMMGWLCTKTAEAQPDSPVAKLMSSGETTKDEYTHGKGIKIDSKTWRQAWVLSYAQSQQQWVDQLKKGMSNPTEWHFKALTTALNSPRAEIMCMNKCICTDESQPTDEGYRMNDEVPLGRKPMDCWWEPISHTAEDRTRHLHRESLDGEADELMVPSYKYRFGLIAYNEAIYEAHKGECSEYSQVHEAMPCAKIHRHRESNMSRKDKSRNIMLIWDTGSTCNVHMDGM